MSLAEMEEVQASEASSSQADVVDSRRFHRWRGTFWQFLRYCLVGGANTAIDLLLLNLLLWRFPTNNPQVLVLYNSIAYTSGALSSFVLNKYWTFRHKQRATSREVRRFVISLLIEIGYNSALIWLAGKALQPVITNPTLWGNASKLIAVAIGTIISYSLMRFWTFAGAPQDRLVGSKSGFQTTAGTGDRQTIDGAEPAHQQTGQEGALERPATGPDRG